MAESYERAVEVCKVDAELGIVFGWGIISKQDGEPYYDTPRRPHPRRIDAEGRR